MAHFASLDLSAQPQSAIHTVNPGANLGVPPDPIVLPELLWGRARVVELGKKGENCPIHWTICSTHHHLFVCFDWDSVGQQTTELATSGNNPGGGSASSGKQVNAEAAEWNNEEIDQISFYDSDRFEEDSLCSWSSEPDSLCNNWRGWKKPNNSCTFGGGPFRKSAE
uniref:Uncharacterized protein n=1 Tax=Lutzomyia longipalpis TaxID=7200 RepID=A0A1B0CAB9_LUTLO